MSTQPTTPSTDDLRAAAVAATPATPAQSVTPPQPEVVEVDGIKYGKTPEGKFFAELPTGARYLGDNEQQVAINIAKGKVEADRTIQSIKQSVQPQPVERQIAPEIQQAREYLLNEIAQGVGLNNAAELRQRLDIMSQTAESMTNDQVAAGFYQLCPEFPTSEQNVEILTSIASQNGFPETPQGLRAAHLIAVAEKKYSPLTTDQIQLQRMQALGITPQQVAPRTPAPMLPNTSPNNAEPAFNPYDRNVPIDKVREWAMRGQ